MKFFPFLKKYIFDGQPYINKNEIYFDSSYISDTVVQFGDWGQELNIDSETRSLVSFEAIFSPQKIKYVPLTIPEFTNAQIKYDKAEDMKALTIYYDSNTGWFCFGDKDSHGTGYQFATDTVAVIDNNRLDAIYIKPQLK